MKKVLSIVVAASAVAAALTACGAPKPRAVENPATARSGTETTEKADTEEKTERFGSIEIEVGRDIRLGGTPPISGVRRRLPDFSGEYTVEYVHTPRNEPKDETLEYTLDLHGDNSYDMRVVTDGVEANHYGNYYIQSGGGIVLYYDEPLDPSAHNVYTSDSMYGELLPHGKIMIFDNGKIIVLSRSEANARSRSRAVPLPDFSALYGRF